MTLKILPRILNFAGNICHKLFFKSFYFVIYCMKFFLSSIFVFKDEDSHVFEIGLPLSDYFLGGLLDINRVTVHEQQQCN